MDSTSELNTALHLKSMNNIEPLIVQKLEKAGIKSASRISINDNHYSRKGVRSCKKASNLFGVSLICEDQPKIPFTLDNATVSLPKVFVKTINFLCKHVNAEGIFRRAGSINRQKLLRSNELSSLSDSTSPYDVAAILKQYLRELPEPLLTNRLYPVFAEIATCHRMSDVDKQDLILSTSFLLPELHLLCLKVLMQLLYNIAECSAHSLMDSNSLAVVMSPNIFPPCDVSSLKSNTDITKILIEQANDICKVPVDPHPCTTITKHPPNNSHTPWKEYFSDKIRGTLTKLRGGKARLKSDEDFIGTASKISALDSSFDELEINHTPSSLFGTGRRLRKHKLRKKGKPGPIPFHIPLNTPTSSKPHPSLPPIPFIDISKVAVPGEQPLVSPAHTFTTPVTSNTRDYDNNHTAQLPATIGQRVRKRRQYQRDIVQSCSIEFTSVKKPVKTMHMSVSQSDNDLGHMTPANTRPRLKAMFSAKMKTSDKRKGFFHEPSTVHHTTSGAGTVTRSTSGAGIVTRSTSGAGTVTRSTSGAGTVTRSTSGAGTVTHISSGVTRSTSGAGTVSRSTSGAGTVTRSTSGAGTVSRSTSGVTHSTSGAGTVSRSTSSVTRSNARTNKDRRIKYKHNEETQCLLSTTDEDPSECLLNNKEQVVHIPRSSVKDTMSSTKPCPSSPGLLRKITSEISERYQYTPHQIAPILNNDSYLFAMNTSSNDAPCIKRGGGGLHVPSPCTELTTGYDSDNCYPTTTLLSGEDGVNGCSGHGTKKGKPVIVSRSKSFFTTPSAKTNHKSSTTDGKAKLSRRARQYVVIPSNSSSSTSKKPLHPSTSRSTGKAKQQPLSNKSTMVNKQGITVYEWIL